MSLGCFFTRSEVKRWVSIFHVFISSSRYYTVHSLLFLCPSIWQKAAWGKPLCLPPGLKVYLKHGGGCSLRKQECEEASSYLCGQGRKTCETWCFPCLRDYLLMTPQIPSIALSTGVHVPKVWTCGNISCWTLSHRDSYVTHVFISCPTF